MIYIFSNLIFVGFDFFVISAIAIISMGFPLIISLYNNCKSLVYFNAVTFFTILVTLHSFFTFERNDWYLADFNQFDYSIRSAGIIFTYLFIFLCLVTFISLFIFKYIPLNFSSFQKNTDGDIVNKQLIPKHWATLSILLIIAIISPIQYWMFHNSIGFTGITPRELPFKLTGILYFSTKLFIPILIGWLYFISGRSYSLTVLIFFYGVFSSMYSASRGVGVMIIGLPVLFAFHQGKIGRGLAGLFFVALSFSLATFMRTYTQFVDEFGVPNVITTNFDIIEFIQSYLESNKDHVFNIISTALISTFARISSFESMVQAINYNPFKVEGGNPIDLVLLSFNRFTRVFDADSHHLEWQGYTLPTGWYNGGSLLSDAIIVRNFDGFLWLILLAMVSALWLVTIEILVSIAAKNYKIKSIVKSIVIIYLVLLYITNRGSYDLIFSLFFILLLIIYRKYISTLHN